MSFSTIFNFIAPFEALLAPGALTLEQDGINELTTVVAGIQNPLLKDVLTALSTAIVPVVNVVNTEIQKSL
jgi:hypothetical protein